MQLLSSCAEGEPRMIVRAPEAKLNPVWATLLDGHVVSFRITPVASNHCGAERSVPLSTVNRTLDPSLTCA